MDDFFAKLKNFSFNADLGAALGLLLVLAAFIIPIPPVILDLLFSSTLALSVVILLVCVYTKKPLDFSTFPSVLLATTLARLSLNVVSTKNILLNAGTDGTSAAGQIIRSFGEFVIRGNYIVGIIIFLILVIINFMVITKGAGRVAEVAARFTLDAMPGKQMAIDADLNAGLINEEQARTRRSEISREADFYGAMDGASKFVRGDAIAGIMITAVNILGGMLVGIIQYDLSAADAAELFTLLTVGDGLIAQIPALIISVAAGILATRNASDDSLGDQVSKQFKVHPRAILMAAGALFFFSIIPGLPKLPFMSIALVAAFIAFRIEKNNKKDKEQAALKVTEKKKTTSDHLEDLLSLELVELEVGYGLVHLVDSDQNGDLLERITHIRKQFALDWGVIIPSVRIKDNLELKPGGYSIKIKGIEIADGELMADHLMAIDPGSVIEEIEGVETTEPVFGLPAIWVTEDLKEDAQYNGYTVVDLSTVVATHLTEILKTNLHELFGRQELVNVLEHFKTSTLR